MLSIVFTVGVRGNKREPLYDEKLLNSLMSGASDFFNGVIIAGYVFYGLAVVCFILCRILDNKIGDYNSFVFIIDLVALIAIPAFYILGLIYACGAPETFSLSQVLIEKMGLFLGQVLGFIPDCILSVLNFLFNLIYITWTGIRPILFLLLAISLLLSFILSITKKYYRWALRNYKERLKEIDQGAEWNSKNFERVNGLLNRYKTHLIPIDDFYYQKYLDSL